MTLEPIRKSITVACSRAHAFKVYTEGFDSWWPREHHLGEAALAEAVLEPREGGRWFERLVDGSECGWGRVLAWEPPGRVVLSWHIDGDWKVDPDPAHASEIEVLFTEEGPGTTRVEIEHREFERHGATAQQVYDGVDTEGGWTGLLKIFAAKAAA
ncbi:SRPBCC family protein [Amycolatopsis sp. FDAARGOS 1241]|uniref:SRPBCC family protein n=1 Tax=Amycolatopsis sp. FDAARGOS 1241 TaxID=2778070 RepID=UPI00194E7066|nr:SRPBCC family protein [Amycolatopsis sp. FDAARGOS 1241]QRP43865.1 SRPBCC family protein [Amycolatopsis sp. FDAARGOS 1241]